MRKVVAALLIITIIFIVIFAAQSSSIRLNNQAKSAVSKNHSPAFEKFFVTKEAFEIRKRINDFFRKQYSWGNFAGAVLVSYKSQIIYKDAFGYANRKLKTPVTTQTAFQIGSMSKQFTAIAILQLISKGKLSLDQDVSSIYPDFPFAGITIRMLLTHRSGLPNYIYELENSSLDKEVLMNNQQAVDYMINLHEKTYSRPNRHYQYSNTGYILLAAIVEKISGLSFENYMKKNIFEPLGMKHTFFYNDVYENKVPDNIPVATGYLSPYQEAKFYYLNGIKGDKGIFTTVDDLHRWDTSLYKGYILPKNYIDSAFAKQTRTRLSNVFYGFGWKMYFLDDTLPVYFHSGWWQGYQSVIMRIPKDTITVIVLKNKKTDHPINQRAIIDLFYPNNRFWGKSKKQKSTINDDE
ncbi:MAG: beta-lactamase family protein [Bacteroidales bacterium]|nr:beta-lactamase family protein [Bacteroidales bacterium]